MLSWTQSNLGILLILKAEPVKHSRGESVFSKIKQVKKIQLLPWGSYLLPLVCVQIFWGPKAVEAAVSQLLQAPRVQDRRKKI